MADTLKRLGMLSGLLGFVVLVLDVLGFFLTSRMISGASGEEFGALTPGAMVLIVRGATGALQFLVGVVGVAALGYWAGRPIDLDEEYQRLLLVVGGAGVAGYGPGYLLFVGVNEGITPLGLSFGAGSVVALGVRFALAGFAGAAIAHVTDDDAIAETLTEFERYHFHGD